MAVPDVRLVGVTKRFGDLTAVDALDLEVARGEFVALLGPSGCGKTTCLRMVSGLERPDAGRVEVAGRDVTATPPGRRGVATVFQSYALFGHLDVRRNVEFGLRQQRVPAQQRRRRAMEALELVRLAGLADRRPAQLSGGQQQRVALARALVLRPQVLLLDEPLAALDLQLRKEMQVELKRLHTDVGSTFVFVTHDQGEAMSMADRVAVLHRGRVEQLDTPATVYDRPASRFVAGFIGDMTVLSGQCTDGVVPVGEGRLPCPLPDGPVEVTVRPQDVHVGPPPEGALQLPVRVFAVDVLGDRVRLLLDVDAPAGTASLLSYRPRHEHQWQQLVAGDLTQAWFLPRQAHVFAREQP